MVLTVEDARWRVLRHNGAVLLVTVVSAVVQLVTDQRAQAQTVTIGALELALCEGICGRYVSLLHTSPCRSDPSAAAADAARDAGSSAGPSGEGGAWGQGGGLSGQDCTFLSRCHRGASTV